ncbi:MAG TPA: hypothetical protein PK760_06030 [Flavobacteriales bacterium]|nr:hypothetical protein [Flavobacteriales bacterium]
MRTLITLLALVGTFALHAQNVIYSHAIGNWRNGPTVYITPLVQTTEAVTKPKLKEQFRAQYAELKDIPDTDFDVLLFGTKEEGDESRRVLQAKYGIRKLPVVMLKEAAEKSVPEGTTAPK